MKLCAFNVNGIRAIINKDFATSFSYLNPDILVLGETKLSDAEAPFPYLPEGYEIYHTISKLRKGYSGVAIYTREKPLSVHYGLEDGHYDEEGRVITLEYPGFYLVGAYVPNAGDGLKRLDFRLQYEKELAEYLSKLDRTKPVIYTGDLNVAHKPIDITNPKANEHNPGYTIEERTAFDALLNKGFTDTYRYLHPDTVKYSWWSYRFHAREKNTGWRIDYFLVSNRIADKVTEAEIHNEVYGSDHCPISLTIEL